MKEFAPIVGLFEYQQHIFGFGGGGSKCDGGGMQLVLQRMQNS